MKIFMSTSRLGVLHIPTIVADYMNLKYIDAIYIHSCHIDSFSFSIVVDNRYLTCQSNPNAIEYIRSEEESIFSFMKGCNEYLEFDFTALNLYTANMGHLLQTIKHNHVAFGYNRFEVRLINDENHYFNKHGIPTMKRVREYRLTMYRPNSTRGESIYST